MFGQTLRTEKYFFFVAIKLHFLGIVNFAKALILFRFSLKILNSKLIKSFQNIILVQKIDVLIFCDTHNIQHLKNYQLLLFLISEFQGSLCRRNAGTAGILVISLWRLFLFYSPSKWSALKIPFLYNIYQFLIINNF